ncbi:contact-dependent growth inhibition system immunity protein [Burkholderia glumae]|uniref:contact-dependent growth inhibition system immunity protein n=1 Tax=Burkholderia glumae TaxID=337 RepID=UPI00131F6213|nr:contact-dependent growth inhibition system immunity protein [Burkholderia glumae]QHE11241.1 hypothetical protein GQR88_13005 [Burkholderia glumae AU6208]
MKSSDRYPELSNFIKNYFGEDFDLWGNTIEEIFALYKSENDISARSQLGRDIDAFRCDNSSDLDVSFKALYGLFFNPVSWNHTTASFLDELKRLLSE